ncbi:MAG: hypothetical protein CMP23_04450 [Rickettsiales bacterium]|nr:hypothetical protein [Rickettsiales bacterium]
MRTRGARLMVPATAEATRPKGQLLVTGEYDLGSLHIGCCPQLVFKAQLNSRLQVCVARQRAPAALAQAKESSGTFNGQQHRGDGIGQDGLSLPDRWQLLSVQIICAVRIVGNPADHILGLFLLQSCGTAQPGPGICYDDSHLQHGPATQSAHRGDQSRGRLLGWALTSAQIQALGPATSATSIRP